MNITLFTYATYLSEFLSGKRSALECHVNRSPNVSMTLVEIQVDTTYYNVVAIDNGFKMEVTFAESDEPPSKPVPLTEEEDEALINEISKA